jgi:RimJ/RimL family protein N-acetyltransferase
MHQTLEPDHRQSPEPPNLIASHGESGNTQRMMSLVDAFPPFGVAVACGPIALRPITDDVLSDLVDLARAGIHAPDRMPFSVPWTDTPPEDFARQFVTHHWRARSGFTRTQWSLDFAVHHDGVLVGTQSISTHSYLVTRTGETGSWLGMPFQGKGIGTLMRQAICALMFDHLDAVEITSGAFLDNPASLAVSRKVGYRPNGQLRQERRPGDLGILQQLVLSPEDLVRPAEAVQVQGIRAFRAFVGLD